MSEKRQNEEILIDDENQDYIDESMSDSYVEGDYTSHDEEYADYYEDEIEEYDEEIIGDSFEEDIYQTVKIKGTIADVYDQQQEARKKRREQFAEKKRDEYVRPEKKTKKKSKGKNDEDIIISLENVTKSYVKGVPALNNVNIKIKRGEFVFIVGGSGSGKSTLIKLLLRELKPTSGSIMVNGYQVDKLRKYKIPRLRRSIGVVFQDFRLLMDRNVYENVAFAQRIIQTPAREMKKNVPNMLSIVGLASMYKKKPNELSGGEQQRVALARALVNRPPILLADEPTGNLDPANTEEIMNLLERINEKGTTVVVVTHNDKVVNDMKKRVITIKKGVIVSDEKKGGYLND